MLAPLKQRRQTAPVVRWIIVAVACLVAVPAVPAQYEYAAEVAVGYSTLNIEPGVEFDKTRMNGWNIAVTGYYNEWIGFAADVSNQYGNATPRSGFGGTTSVDLTHWSYLGGPEVRVVRTERFAASARTLFGASRGNAKPDTFTVDDTPTRYSFKNTKFSMVIGAAFDVNITPQLAWRVQPQYLITSFSSKRQGNFGFTTGILYRFGIRAPTL